MAGAICRACSNKSRTRAAPTPTNISTNSEPEMEKNGTPASPATARAKSVLPVPGGPTSRIPLGTRPPRRPYSLGSFRKLMISTNSSFASSTPATSVKVTLVSVSTNTLARLLPIDIRPPLIPPGFMRRMINSQIPTKIAIGSSQDSKSRTHVL